MRERKGRRGKQAVSSLLKKVVDEAKVNVQSLDEVDTESFGDVIDDVLVELKLFSETRAAAKASWRGEFRRLDARVELFGRNRRRRRFRVLSRKLGDQ